MRILLAAVLAGGLSGQDSVRVDRFTLEAAPGSSVEATEWGFILRTPDRDETVGIRVRAEGDAPCSAQSMAPDPPSGSGDRAEHPVTLVGPTGLVVNAVVKGTGCRNWTGGSVVACLRYQGATTTFHAPAVGCTTHHDQDDRVLAVLRTLRPAD